MHLYFSKGYPLAELLAENTNLYTHTYYWSPGSWRGHVREYVKNDLYLLSKYLGLNIKRNQRI